MGAAHFTSDYLSDSENHQSLWKVLPPSELKTQSSRHKGVKETFRNLLIQYGFTPDLVESRFDNGRGPDIYFLPGKRLVLVDVTVVNPLAHSYVDKEAAEPSFTVMQAERLKRRTHEEMAGARGIGFFPLAFTTYGVPGPETLQFLNLVARKGNIR